MFIKLRQNDFSKLEIKILGFTASSMPLSISTENGLYLTTLFLISYGANLLNACQPVKKRKKGGNMGLSFENLFVKRFSALLVTISSVTSSLFASGLVP